MSAIADLIAAESRGPRCATCSDFRPVQDGVGECMHAPPVVQLIPMPSLAGGDELRKIGVRPPVTHDEWCGSWRSRLS